MGVGLRYGSRINPAGICIGLMNELSIGETSGKEGCQAREKKAKEMPKRGEKSQEFELQVVASIFSAREIVAIA